MMKQSAVSKKTTGIIVGNKNYDHLPNVWPILWRDIVVVKKWSWILCAVSSHFMPTFLSVHDHRSELHDHIRTPWSYQIRKWKLIARFVWWNHETAELPYSNSMTILELHDHIRTPWSYQNMKINRAFCLESWNCWDSLVFRHTSTCDDKVDTSDPWSRRILSCSEYTGARKNIAIPKVIMT